MPRRRRTYRRAIQLAPNYLPTRSNFGLSLAITGPPQEAVAQLAPIATARGSDGRVRQNLAFAYAMAGDFENALQISRRDLDEKSAQQQLYYYMQLKAIPVEQRSLEIRRNPQLHAAIGAGHLGRDNVGSEVGSFPGFPTAWETHNARPPGF